MHFWYGNLFLFLLRCVSFSRVYVFDDCSLHGCLYWPAIKANAMVRKHAITSMATITTHSPIPYTISWRKYYLSVVVGGVFLCVPFVPSSFLIVGYSIWNCLFRSDKMCLALAWKCCGEYVRMCARDLIVVCHFSVIICQNQTCRIQFNRFIV